VAAYHHAVDADPLEASAWRWIAGDLTSGGLPALATDALMRGIDSPALRELAAQNPGQVRDSQDLFREAGWPGSGGFTSQDHAESVVTRGQLLVVRLAAELGPGYFVEYMPEPIRPPGVKLRVQQ
jgi:hypothetical protein